MTDEKKNSGYMNSGYMNSGYMNSGNWNSGYMNTTEPPVRLFNKDTDVKREDIVFPNFFYFNLIEWIEAGEMTDEEKAEHPLYETTGGYLKKHDYKEAFQESYKNATKEDKELLFNLPNFDAAIFKEITGIDVNGMVEIKVEGKTIEISRESAKALGLVD